jgi:endonuclease-3
VFDYLKTKIDNPETELLYDNPYQLLVAVVLSAQCTDKRVNMVTPNIFLKYPSSYELAQASVEEIFDIIKSISYPNNKAKYLKGLAEILTVQYQGEVPRTVEQLIQLPGVGRKTANVITSVIDQQPNMAVDTHVFRLSKRLGLITQKTTTPLSAEKQLIKYIPAREVHLAHHLLILYGRYTCTARNPKCQECGLQNVCTYYKNSASS